MIRFNSARVAIATATAIALGSTFAIAARAGDVPHKIVLSYIEGAAGSQALQVGKYAEAIKQIASRRFDSDEVSKSTNLCVALVMTHEWDSAKKTCDDAVINARLDSPDPAFGISSGHNAGLALAYSNRAVLNFLAGRSQEAVRDATRARRLSPQSEFVTQNWVVMNAATPGVSGPAIAAVAR